jgi:hypothetical protein
VPAKPSSPESISLRTRSGAPQLIEPKTDERAMIGQINQPVWVCVGQVMCSTFQCGSAPIPWGALCTSKIYKLGFTDENVSNLASLIDEYKSCGSIIKMTSQCLVNANSIALCTTTPEVSPFTSPSTTLNASNKDSEKLTNKFCKGEKEL